MTNSTVEIIRILADKLNALGSSATGREKFYQDQIAKLVDAHCKEIMQ